MHLERTHKVDQHEAIHRIDTFLDEPSRGTLIEASEALDSRFNYYWNRVNLEPHKTTIALPFYHLKNDGFWHLVPLPGKETALDHLVRIRKSRVALRSVVAGATFDQALHHLMTNRNWAQHLRSVLICNYFAPELHAALVGPAKIA